MSAAIRMESLTKDYAVGFWRPRPYRALDGLTLDIEAGEVFGFLGPNGAGKTTTLKLLMQLIFPTAGRAEILGRPVGDVAVRRRIGYLPENPYFYDYLTAEELLAYFAAAVRLRARPNGASAWRRCSIAVGIGAERRLQLRKFSKGMMQRVGIAQALLERSRGHLPRRADVGARSARPPRRPRADPRAARPAAGPCSSAPTSSPMPRRSAAAWRSSPAAGWPPRARSPISLAFQLRGWELVVAGVTAGAARRIAPACPRSDGDLARAATRSSCRSISRPERLLPRAHRRRAPRSCRSTRCVTRSRTSSSSASRRSGAAREPARRRCAPISVGRDQRVPRVGARPRALQPRAVRGAR